MQNPPTINCYSLYREYKDNRVKYCSNSRIVLVHPGSSIAGADNNDGLYGDLKAASSSFPAQGLCSLAAIVRENGYNPKIIDAEPLGLDTDKTAECAMEDNPEYIGITSYTVSFQVTLRIASKIKEIAKQRKIKTTIIIGGPHLTFLSKKVLEKYAQFDIGIYGEGEITIVELLDALDHNRSLENIPNLIYREDTQVIKNRRRPPLDDMDELPLPAWDLLPQLDRYYHPAGDNLNRLPSLAIITSRGCPGQCYFCNPKGLGSKFRGHSAQYIIKMMKHLQTEFGIRDVFIADDMFLYDRENVMAFCKLLHESPDINITWSVFGRVEYVSLDILLLMKKAGCWQIGYGLESGSEKILKLINKKQTVAQMEKAITDANNAGIIVRGMFMVGCFGETRDTIEETIAFVKRNTIKDFHVTFFTPMPGTASFGLWPKYGTFEGASEEGSHMSQHDIAFVPNGMDREELVAYQRRIYRAFLKPATMWYHFKKLFRPSVAFYVLKGGFALSYYCIVKK